MHAGHQSLFISGKLSDGNWYNNRVRLECAQIRHATGAPWFIFWSTAEGIASTPNFAYFTIRQAPRVSRYSISIESGNVGTAQMPEIDRVLAKIRNGESIVAQVWPPRVNPLNGKIIGVSGSTGGEGILKWVDERTFSFIPTIDLGIKTGDAVVMAFQAGPNGVFQRLLGDDVVWGVLSPDTAPRVASVVNPPTTQMVTDSPQSIAVPGPPSTLPATAPLSASPTTVPPTSPSGIAPALTLPNPSAAGGPAIVAPSEASSIAAPSATPPVAIAPAGPPIAKPPLDPPTVAPVPIPSSPPRVSDPPIAPPVSPAEAQAAFDAGDAAAYSTKPDYATALKLFRKAAGAGHLGAQADLGGLYLLGHGTPKNVSEGLTLIRASANRGDSEGERWLGVAYDHGYGVPQDLAESFRQTLRSAEQGNRRAQWAIGGKFQAGIGVRADRVQAAKWYRQAADSGLTSAAVSLGKMLYEGPGTPRDREEGLRLLRSAARNDNTAARLYLQQHGLKW